MLKHLHLSLMACSLWAVLAPAHGTVTIPADAASAPQPRATVKVYKYLNEGTTSFSDRPPTRGVYTILTPSCFACSIESNVDWHATRLHLDEFDFAIDSAVRQYGVEPALVRAVIHAESGFNAKARSRKGAMGLMQLMPGTARDMGVADPSLPDLNIRGGTRYLAGLLLRFRGDVKLAVAAYNAGPEAVARYAGIPPYAETRVYVQRVQILHQRYKDALHS
jgi:soluble lytic murein transglycosylase-like protein